MTTRQSPLIIALLVLIAALAGACGRQPQPTPTAAPATSTPLPPSATPTPVPTSTPTDRPTATFTLSPTPTSTPIPTATPTPVPAPRRLTDGGCCFGPFFLDGKVAFIDRPTATAPVGVYAVTLQGGAPELVEKRLGSYLNGGEFLAYEDGAKFVIERRRDGQRLSFPGLDKVANFSGVTLSPDASQVSWSVRQTEGPFDERVTELWRVAATGKAPEKVISLFGGGLIAWLPGDRWLLSGRRAVAEADRTLFVYDLASGKSVELFQAQGFRNARVSPDGQWIVFLVTLDPKRERNGIWLVRTDGKESRKLDFFGAFAWRDATHLLYMPFQEATQSHEVWAYDVTQMKSTRITDPALTRFKIAQGDFAFAPDGSGLVYVSADDLNLWWLPLPASRTGTE
jgi:hypothetical protein